MLKNRVIPALLMLNGGLVKTTRFKEPKYVGDPINAIRIFNEKEVDELMLLDIGASKNRSEPDYQLIEEVASECFMPLCYGGGVSTLDQAARIYALGVEKICLQSAMFDNPDLVAQLADRFGSQAVVVSVDVKRNWLNKPTLYESRKSASHGQRWETFVQEAVSRGAGEILLNAVHQDGTQAGYDLELVQAATRLVDVPIIAVGGASKISDFAAAVQHGASAVAAGSMFVFQGPHRAVLITYPDYQALETALNPL